MSQKIEGTTVSNRKVNHAVCSNDKAHSIGQENTSHSKNARVNQGQSSYRKLSVLILCLLVALFAIIVVVTVCLVTRSGKCHIQII